MSSSYLSVHNIETNKDKDFFNFLSKLQDDSHQDIRKKFLMTDAKKLTLIQKEKMAIERIKDFLNRCDAEGKVPVISFSGGKDSCVVRHLVSRVRKGIKCETAAELFHPEIASFLRTIPKNEITLFAPTMPFEQIIKEEGYPVLSKEVAQKVNNVRNCVTLGKWVLACFGLRSSRPIPKKYLHFLDKNLIKYNVSSKCCSLIKGAVKSSKSPKFVGTTIQESQLRRTSWLKHGCNFYSSKSYKCRPISLFNEEDVWTYIDKYKVPYSKAYGVRGNKWKRTGCVCCGFGLSFEQMLSRKGLGRSRIELLFDYYPHTYKKYIHDLKMIRPLCDAGIDLNVTDNIYKKYFIKRQRLIQSWYSPQNFKNNLLNVLKQIEKQTKKQFTNGQRSKIFKQYGVNNV